MNTSRPLLSSIDVPQADDIWAVVDAVAGVQAGHTTADGLSAYLDDRTPRQGNYYMQAARILGFLRPDRRTGELRVSALGSLLLESDKERQRALLRRAALECPPARELCYALIASGEGLSREALASWAQALAPLAPSTAARRAQTLVSWLRCLGIASWRDGQLIYHGPPLPKKESPPSGE